MPLQQRVVDTHGLEVRWTIPRTSTAAVWHALTDVAALPGWLGTPVQHDLRAGGRLVIDHGEGYLSTSDVLECENGSVLRMTWAFPNEADSQVAFRLSPDADGVLLELRHDLPRELVADYAAGWCVHLTYLEAVVQGEPLPGSLFWNLHASFAALAPDAA